MNGDTFSIKAPKECSKKFGATLRRKFLTRGNVLRIFFLFLEDLGVPQKKRCRHSSHSDSNFGPPPPNFSSCASLSVSQETRKNLNSAHLLCLGKYAQKNRSCKCGSSGWSAMFQVAKRIPSDTKVLLTEIVSKYLFLTNYESHA